MRDLQKILDERRAVDQELAGFGDDLKASEQRKFDRLLETRSRLGEEIAGLGADAPLEGRALEIVRANFSTRLEKRDALMALDEKAAGRAFTAAEERQALELRSEIDQIDNRITAQLGMAVKKRETREAIDRMGLTDVLDTRGGGSTVRERGPAGFEFRSEDIHGLWEAVRGGVMAGRIECRSVSAYPADRNQSAVGTVARRIEPTRILSLMPTQQVTSATATYWSAIASGGAGATAAATVAPGASKPESTPGWVEQTATIRKIAHWTGIPKEGLDDYPSFEQIVRDEMVSGLINVENSQLISGGGTGTDLLGLLNTVGIQTYAPAGAEARALSILHAQTMLRTGSGFLEADTVVAHPTDWEIVQKWASTTGELITGDPGQATARNLWGVNLIITTGITAGTGLVANLAASTVAFLREAPTVMVDPYSASTNNIVKFIAEERLALGVLRPTGLVKITYNGTT